MKIALANYSSSLQALHVYHWIRNQLITPVCQLLIITVLVAGSLCCYIDLLQWVLWFSLYFMLIALILEKRN